MKKNRQKNIAKKLTSIRQQIKSELNRVKGSKMFNEIRNRAIQSPFITKPTIQELALRATVLRYNNLYSLVIITFITFEEYKTSSFIPIWNVQTCYITRIGKRVVNLNLLPKKMSEELLEANTVALSNSGVIKETETKLEFNGSYVRTPLTDSEIELLPKGFKELIRK